MTYSFSARSQYQRVVARERCHNSVVCPRYYGLIVAYCTFEQACLMMLAAVVYVLIRFSFA